VAGTIKDCKVHLNGKSLSSTVKDFKKYVEMYAVAARDLQGGGALLGASPSGAAAGGKPTILLDTGNARWEVAFTPSDGQFQQVSFVNNIATTKGGTHVEHVAKAMADAISAVVEKKNKGGLALTALASKLTTFSRAANKVKPHQIKQHMWIFVNCLIENPSFDSQTKENMTLAVSKFGSKYKLQEEFAKKSVSPHLHASITYAWRSHQVRRR
jgi:DNA topoisomerase-2